MVDFMSIGTNDLLQYTVAVDRSNDTVSSYYTPYNQGFLKLVLQTIQNANHQKIPVSICGELAADVNFTIFLLLSGLRNFSVSVPNILSLKQTILSINLTTYKSNTKFIHKISESLIIKRMIKSLNSKHKIKDDKL
jgi:phosphotransferase system enzyme I (PtsI)